jgi:methionyl-tRNA formyltransferase
MNIVFFGTSGFAVPALERLIGSGHKVLGVVTQPDRPAGRGQELLASPIKELALAKGLYLFQPEDCNEYEFLRELRALSPDVIVVVAYGQKLGNEILQLARYHCVNIHPSLLPRYRGAEPVARAILAGETHTGVCIVKVVEKMDAGPVLGLARVPVPPEAATPELEEQLSELGAELLTDVLAQIEARTALEIPQEEREATYAKRFEKSEGRVDWRKPAAKIHQFVRALIPYPCAFGSFNGKTRVIFWKVKPNRYPQKPPPEHRPGTILAVDKDAFTVATADGEVSILEIQPESKRRMNAAEFINGYQPKPGMFFS